MEIDFWQQRWQDGQIGFHKNIVNPYLAFFYGEKGPPAEKREALKIFVPLCGKSLDMLWLAQNGYRIFGVECSEQAVKSFFEENAIRYKSASNDEHALYIADTPPVSSQAAAPRDAALRAEIEIYQGDFFALQSDLFEDVTDVFDRASLIALPPEMRREYAAKMGELLKPGARTLLVTLSYDQAEMNGPPFSVSEEELNDLYAEHFTIQKLCFKNIIDDEPHMQERGLTALVETVYKLVRK